MFNLRTRMLPLHASFKSVFTSARQLGDLTCLLKKLMWLAVPSSFTLAFTVFESLKLSLTEAHQQTLEAFRTVSTP